MSSDVPSPSGQQASDSVPEGAEASVSADAEQRPAASAIQSETTPPDRQDQSSPSQPDDGSPAGSPAVETPPVDAATSSADDGSDVADEAPVPEPVQVAPSAPEQPNAEQPVPEQPAPEQPVTEQPVTEQPVTVPSVPAATTPAAPADATSSSLTVEQPASEQPARPVKLQPTGSGDAKAVPSLPESELSEAAAAAERRTEPVEVPRDADLDASLEAEIAAAMSQELTAPEPAAAPAAPATDDPTAAAAEEPLSEETLEAGRRLKATVQSVDAENVFVDIGLRSPGLIQARQFEAGKLPEVGAKIDVVVDRVDEAEGLIYLNVPRGRRRVGGNWDAVSVGQVVDCMVTKSNKGGLEVSISNLRGFLPAGQVDVGYVADLEPYVGQKLTVQVIEVNPRKRNLVVSRRALLEAERQEVAQEFWGKASVGDVFNGRVKTVKDYGAFIDLGGIDGFLHIGEMSWSRIKHPTEVLQAGQNVDVKILSLDPEKSRIGLGMKQLVQNPWNQASDRYPTGSTVSGKVTRTTDFGAFVELDPGVEGLIHISELDHRRVNRVTDVVNVGQQIDVKVLEVDTDRKRIGLSLKALTAAPEAPAKPSDEEQAPSSGEAYTRKRKGPLRGGYGQGAGGGLFGDPSDFGG